MFQKQFNHLSTHHLKPTVEADITVNVHKGLGGENVYSFQASPNESVQDFMNKLHAIGFVSSGNYSDTLLHGSQCLEKSMLLNDIPRQQDDLNLYMIKNAGPNRSHRLRQKNAKLERKCDQIK